jgi:hypothetical protein
VTVYETMLAAMAAIGSSDRDGDSDGWRPCLVAMAVTGGDTCWRQWQ